MILAVLEARCGLTFGNKDVYVNVAGGLKVTEPAGDLATAAALVSALRDRPLLSEAVFFGEIGLSGEIRPVHHTAARLKEAAKLGFKTAYVGNQTQSEAPPLALISQGFVNQLAVHIAQSAKTAA